MKPGYAVLGLLAIAAAGAVPALAGDPEPPLKQLAQGVPPDEILCAGGKVLVQAGGLRPACVSQDTAGRMQDRGWRIIESTANKALQISNLEDVDKPIPKKFQSSEVIKDNAFADPWGLVELKDGPSYSFAPSKPRYANTTMSISNIPRVGDATVIILETTYPATYLTNKWKGDWNESWEGNYPWKLEYHPENLNHENKTRVGFSFPTSWEILELDPRLNKPEIITNKHGNSYLVTDTQLSIETGVTYSFVATIKPIEEGHTDVAGSGFAGDKVLIPLSIGYERSMLKQDYIDNNETYLAHTKITRGAEKHDPAPRPEFGNDIPSAPAWSKMDYDNYYQKYFQSNLNFTIRDMVVELIDGGYTVDEIKVFLKEFMNISNMDIDNVSYDPPPPLTKKQIDDHMQKSFEERKYLTIEDMIRELRYAAYTSKEIKEFLADRMGFTEVQIGDISFDGYATGQSSTISITGKVTTPLLFASGIEKFHASRRLYAHLEGRIRDCVTMTLQNPRPKG